MNTTTDSEKIVEKIRKMKPGGGAALYDAIYMACTSRNLVQGEPFEPRRVLIIIGDGHDNASKKSLEEVLEIAQRNLVTIYGIEHGGLRIHQRGRQEPERLAEETGGRVEYPLQGAVQGRVGLSFDAVGRRQLRLQGGHGRIRGGDRRAAFSRRWRTWPAKSPRSTSCATSPDTNPETEGKGVPQHPGGGRICPTSRFARARDIIRQRRSPYGWRYRSKNSGCGRKEH